MVSRASTPARGLRRDTPAFRSCQGAGAHGQSSGGQRHRCWRTVRGKRCSAPEWCFSTTGGSRGSQSPDQASWHGPQHGSTSRTHRRSRSSTSVCPSTGDRHDRVPQTGITAVPNDRGARERGFGPAHSTSGLGRWAPTAPADLGRIEDASPPPCRPLMTATGP